MNMELKVRRPFLNLGDHIQIKMPLVIEPIDRLGTPLVIEDDASITVDLYRIDDGWSLHAFGLVMVEVLCDRCLAPTKYAIPLDFHAEILEDAVMDDPEPGEQTPLWLSKKGWVDISARVREEMILKLPLKLICDEACRGLCAKCGQNLNEGSCDCEIDDTDPRLSPLAELKEKMLDTETEDPNRGG